MTMLVSAYIDISNKSTRKKGQVPLVIDSFNAKSLKNKESALRHAMGKRSIDVCIINEVY